MARKKPLINFNVPKGGRITTGKIITGAVTGAIIIGVWNWSDQIPGVGPYVAVGKYYILKALGTQYLAKPQIPSGGLA